MPGKNQKKIVHHNLIGLIPAAGTASRLGPLPCSKELLPVGFHKNRKGGHSQPKAIAHYLLERMQTADVSRVYIILRKGKWDILNYFGDGKMLNISIAYLLMDLPFGVPYTLDQAYPFINDATVVFGFPDIIFQPKDAYVKLLNKQADTLADIVLGIFPTDQPHKMDMVDFDKEGQVCGIQIKPSQTDLRFAWIIAIWTPVFTNFMHESVVNELTLKLKRDGGGLTGEKQELYIGDIFQKALDYNLSIECVRFSTGTCIDIGTPSDLISAMQFTENN